MAATIYKEYFVTPGEMKSDQVTLIDPGNINVIVEANGTPDAWFEWSTSPLTIGMVHVDHVLNYSFTAPFTFGTYEFFLIEYVEDAEAERPREWKVVVHVTHGSVEFANCCGDRNIAWLNIQGGWQNYIFSGVKTFSVEASKGKQFKTNQYVSKYAQIDGVYNGEVLTTGDIPKAHVDALDGLRYSIQAFLFNDETQAWDIPILVDVGSFTKYKSNDKFYEVRLKFIYAEEILVQTQ